MELKKIKKQIEIDAFKIYAKFLTNLTKTMKINVNFWILWISDKTEEYSF